MRIIPISSGKGGVGKTTLALNYALSLSRHGRTILVMYTTWPFFRNSFAVLEGSPDPGGIPARWALKGVIIVAFGIMVLQGISETIKRFYWGMGWEEPRPRQEPIR